MHRAFSRPLPTVGTNTNGTIRVDFNYDREVIPTSPFPHFSPSDGEESALVKKAR